MNNNNGMSVDKHSLCQINNKHEKIKEKDNNKSSVVVPIHSPIA